MTKLKSLKPDEIREFDKVKQEYSNRENDIAVSESVRQIELCLLSGEKIWRISIYLSSDSIIDSNKQRLTNGTGRGKVVSIFFMLFQLQLHIRNCINRERKQPIAGNQPQEPHSFKFNNSRWTPPYPIYFILRIQKVEVQFTRVNIPTFLEEQDSPLLTILVCIVRFFLRFSLRYNNHSSHRRMQFTKVWKVTCRSKLVRP